MAAVVIKSRHRSTSPAAKPIAVIELQSPTEQIFSLEAGAVQVTLNADTSTHTEGTSLTYTWQLIERPAASNSDITSADSAITEFTADFPVYM